MINSDQTKDHEKAMMDLEEHYRWPKLNLPPLRDSHWSKPKAGYTLTFVQRQDMCKWVQELKLLDRYTLNLGRCMNVTQGKLFCIKSHDCHVFMDCLLLVALRELCDHV